MTKNMANVTLNAVLLIVLAFLTGVNSLSIFGGPLHASCKVDWTFEDNCNVVKTKLVNQIEEWNGPKNCDNGGEKCLYKGFSESETWYAHLDYGTNFCNMKNLIIGAKFGDIKEKTDDSICTQYSEANCENY